MPRLSDRVVSYLRTLWPLLLGHLTAWALTRVDALGLPVDDVLVAELVAVAATAVVYTAARSLEEREGEAWWARAARGLGRFLLSLGLDTGGPPVYGTPPAETQSRTVLGPDGEIAEIHTVTRWPRNGLGVVSGDLTGLLANRPGLLGPSTTDTPKEVT